MAGYYPYIISSLPALTFGMKPPLTFSGLLKRCEGFIPRGDARLVGLASSIEPGSHGGNPTLKQWCGFNTMIRNELVNIRAARLKAEAARYLRRDGCPESSYSAHIAINAYRKPSPLDGEKALDQDRWRQLDELGAGHYFDIDALIVYACKLLILEKWEKITEADGASLLERALGQNKPQ